jgi:hypothetical protein
MDKVQKHNSFITFPIRHILTRYTFCYNICKSRLTSGNLVLAMRCVIFLHNNDHVNDIIVRHVVPCQVGDSHS